MTDSNYIPAAKREHVVSLIDRSSLPHGSRYFALHDSHAVADSVMHDLAEALRESRNLYDYSARESIRKFEQWRRVAETALARFDALTKVEA